MWCNAILIASSFVFRFVFGTEPTYLGPMPSVCCLAVHGDSGMATLSSFYWYSNSKRIRSVSISLGISFILSDQSLILPVDFLAITSLATQFNLSRLAPAPAQQSWPCAIVCHSASSNAEGSILARISVERESERLCYEDSLRISVKSG